MGSKWRVLAIFLITNFNICSEIETLLEKKVKLALKNNSNIPEVLSLLGDHIKQLGDQRKEILLRASRKGYKDLVEKLLKDNVKINVRDKCGRTPLILATQDAQKEVVELLITRQANPDFQAYDKNTALMISAEKSNLGVRYVEILKMLLNAKANPNIQNQNGDTALLLALNHLNNNALEVARALLSSGAYPNLQNSQGRTALWEAANKDLKDIVQLLVKYNANPNIHDEDGETPLIRVARNSSPEIAIILLSAGADATINAQESLLDFSALHWAAKLGNTVLVNLLLKYRPQLNLKNKHGNTPLHEAIIHNHITIARLLLKAGADVNCTNKENLTALKLAQKFGNRALIELIQEEEKQLLEAVKQSNVSKVRLHIKKGIDVNMIDGLGRTGLWEAAKSGCRDIVKMLLDAGANPNIADRVEEETPLIVAARLGYTSIIEDLVKKTNLNHVSKNGTALELATARGHASIVQILLAHKADPSSKNKNGETPLMIAVEKGFKDIVKILLEYPAAIQSINAQNIDKETALIKAMFIPNNNLRKEIVTLLLQKKANANLQDKYGNTAIMIAVDNGYKDVVEILLKYKANLKLKDKYGSNVFYKARNIGRKDIVKVLHYSIEDEED